MSKQEGITVKKEENFSEWYTQVVLKSELVDYSSVKGCMVIRPLGYTIWQKIQDYFNSRLKELNVKNAYFPLFVPESFFKKEAEHARGFTPEVAWIANKEEGERLAIRPTSETVMYDSYSRWIRSYRDLPLKINQWANIVRWETKAVKLFLRTREFLWQEGHCVFETEKEADEDTIKMLKEYKKLCEELLAIEVLIGKKTEKEKFAGALYTTTVEALMPDGKALQMGTSHNLGQDFAKSFNIKFLGRDEKIHIPWQTSWGFSTRLIGALVMLHSDDKGLILPPKIAPTQIVIIPILFEDTRDKVLKAAKEIKNKLKDYSVEIDDREEFTPGYKFNEHELKGIPIRIEIGPKDIKANQIILVRRDTNKKEKVKISQLGKKISETLEDIQKNLYNKSKRFLESSIVKVKSMDELIKAVKNKKIALANFCSEEKCEDLIKDKTDGASSRCIADENSKGKCVYCSKPSNLKVYFAKSY